MPFILVSSRSVCGSSSILILSCADSIDLRYLRVYLSKAVAAQALDKAGARGLDSGLRVSYRPLNAFYQSLRS
jgi:hypothetical protein